jgi:hypothetical protein
MKAYLPDWISETRICVECHAHLFQKPPAVFEACTGPPKVLLGGWEEADC